MSSDVFVIGVGNRDRGDDGIGPIVADVVDARDPQVLTYVAEGDLSGLAMLWQSDQDVVIVDATASGRPPGSIVEIDALAEPLTVDTGLVSSHGVGLAEAIELARLLDRLPRRLTIIGVEATTFEQFDDLTPAVLAAVPAVVDRVHAIVDTAHQGADHA